MIRERGGLMSASDGYSKYISGFVCRGGGGSRRFPRVEQAMNELSPC